MKNGLVAIVMKRAQGSPLHDRKSESYAQWSHRLEELANAPQSQYNKLISDNVILHNFNLQVDPSKPDNIFYDPNLGFTFIDLGIGKYICSLEVPLIHIHNLYYKFKDQVSKKDANNILNIMEKLREAGDIKYVQNEISYSRIKSFVNEILYRE